jgi:hypothetical protein
VAATTSETLIFAGAMLTLEGTNSWPSASEKFHSQFALGA